MTSACMIVLGGGLYFLECFLLYLVINNLFTYLLQCTAVRRWQVRTAARASVYSMTSRGQSSTVNGVNTAVVKPLVIPTASARVLRQSFAEYFYSHVYSFRSVLKLDSALQ